MLGYASFYALMPSDNPDPIAPGGDVAFPSNGPIGTTSVTRDGDSAFTLVEAGTYFVSFVVSATESGQLVLTLNGEELPYTRVGRDSGGAQIVNTTIITTTEDGAVLTVRNPDAAFDTLSLTENAGGSVPVSAQLVILRLA